MLVVVYMTHIILMNSDITDGFMTEHDTSTRFPSLFLPKAPYTLLELPIIDLIAGIGRNKVGVGSNLYRNMLKPRHDISSLSVNEPSVWP